MTENRSSESAASLRQITAESYIVTQEVITGPCGRTPVAKGDFHLLPKKVQRFLAEKVELMRPRGIYICDGSYYEAEQLMEKLMERGVLSALRKYQNSYICRTDPNDVLDMKASWVVTPDKYETVTRTKEGTQPIMGHWMSPEKFAREQNDRFPGCMAGRLMYVIPFSLGPIGSSVSRIGMVITDSIYVVLCMRLMTRVSLAVFDALGDKEFIKCIHSVGLPRPVRQKLTNNWPCNPEKAILAQRPLEREIWSYGSGLLEQKCLALGIASVIARDEGWMAEHMTMMSVTNPDGREKFIAAAFPSGCGRTSLAMLEPTLPGWTVKILSHDVVWMRFNKEGQLIGINPLSGFIGTLTKNCIFTNVAETAEGEFFWEGLEEEIENKNTEIRNWFGDFWQIGQTGRAAHPLGGYMAPASRCPLIHPLWEDSAGVPIHAILFGGRRSEGVPLVFESFSWTHGVLVGASLKSEIVATDQHIGTTYANGGAELVHDPMAMRPFLTYNFGQYLQRWMDLGTHSRKAQVPPIYHVNWFRRCKETREFLWPGLGDNIRVLDWICRRLDGEKGIGEEATVGILPAKGSINSEGLEDVDFDELLSVPRDFWIEEVKETRNFFEEQVGTDLPEGIRMEIDNQERRLCTL